MTSFLQTQSWMEFQESLGRRTFDYDENGVQARAILVPIRFGKKYLHIPYGPEMDFNQMKGGIKQPVAQFTAWLRQIAQENNAIFVKVEPLTNNVSEALVGGGFKRSKKTVEPHRTAVIDLTRGQDKLMDAMHHKTRYSIRVAQKHDLIVEQGDSVDAFWDLLKETTKRGRFGSYPREYYVKLYERYRNSAEAFRQSSGQAQAQIWYTKYEDQEIAAALILKYGDTAYYLHGASDYEHRAKMASYLLHWEIIKTLQSEGLKFYDLWGVDAHKWPGVTRFKLRWGGREIQYPGAFDLTISKAWHAMYKLGRWILRK